MKNNWSVVSDVLLILIIALNMKNDMKKGSYMQ